MGLKEGETTTYDPVSMSWILDAPRDFKIGFLQGMSESDGWVDAGRDVVCLVSSPNSTLFKQMLAGLGIKTDVYPQGSIERLEMPTESAIQLPIFSERIDSNCLTELRIMSKATRLPERRAIPTDPDTTHPQTILPSKQP